MRTYSLKLFNALAIIACICACSGNDTAGGISEETEGIVALTNKKIAGAAQKGPLVKGSNVVIKETSANGTLEPTGREFNTQSPATKAISQLTASIWKVSTHFFLPKATTFTNTTVNGQNAPCVLTLFLIWKTAKHPT